MWMTNMTFYKQQFWFHFQIEIEIYQKSDEATIQNVFLKQCVIFQYVCA